MKHLLMRPILFITALIIGLGCSPKLPPPSPPMPDNYVNISDCSFYNDYSAKERLSRKPFGQSEKVELVSFDGEFESRIDSFVSKLPRGEIPKKNSKIDRSQLKEIITLSTSQLDSLTNIFFNYDYGRTESGIGIISESKTGCYEPRHALLFFKKKTDTQPFVYFEICLECREVKTFPRAYELGNFCRGKYNLLRDFFRQTGIKYGLER